MGKLAIEDVNQASRILIGMLVGGIALRSTLGMTAMIQTLEQQQDWAGQMVRNFLCLHSHKSIMPMRIT